MSSLINSWPDRVKKTPRTIRPRHPVAEKPNAKFHRLQLYRRREMSGTRRNIQDMSLMIVQNGSIVDKGSIAAADTDHRQLAFKIHELLGNQRLFFQVFPSGDGFHQ